jgi:hypothetical protein
MILNLALIKAKAKEFSNGEICLLGKPEQDA